MLLTKKSFLSSGRQCAILTLLVIGLVQASASAAEGNLPAAPVIAPTAMCAAPIPDFSYAGYDNARRAIPEVKDNIIDVTQHGVIADDDRDDSLALAKAYAAAKTINGPVVLQLPAGRIALSQVLKIDRSDIVIRGAGAGAGGTELFFPRPLRLTDKSEDLKELREYLLSNRKYQVEKNNNVNELFSEYSWTGGYLWVGPQGNRPAQYLTAYDQPSKATRLTDAVEGKQGELTLRVANAEKLKAGDVVQIRWFNRDGEQGALIEELYGKDAKTLKVGSNHWTFPDRALAVQSTRIERLENGIATLSSPLLHPISPAIKADIARWEHLENVGIEDMSFVFPEGRAFGHHQEEGYNAIYFTGTYNGWIRNVRVRDADAAILTYDSANLTIADIITEGKREAHYAVHVGNVHNVLVQDVDVFNSVVHAFSVNTQASRNVFLRGRAWQQPVIDQHAGANHQNLFDDMTLYVRATRDEKGVPTYPVWNGSGAGYWEPGHGRYNTTWNLRVLVEGGALPSETVKLTGLSEGPDARLVGISGNRHFEVDYHPAPVMRALNQRLWQAPSLYELQLQHRLRNLPVPTCITD